MNCDETLELFSALMDGELDALAAEAVRAHVGDCALCRESAAHLERAASLVSRYAPVAPRADFLDRLDRRLEIELEADGFVPEVRRSRRLPLRRPRLPLGPALWRLAAAVLLGGAAVTLYHGRPGRPPAPPTHETLPPEPEVAGQVPEPPVVPVARETPVASETATAPSRVPTAVALEAPGEMPVATATAASSPEPGRAVASRLRDPRSDPELRSEPVVARSVPDAAAQRRWLALAGDAQAPLERRKEAIFELARLGRPEAAAFLEETLARRSPLASEAIRAIGSYPRRETLAILLGAADDYPFQVRAALERVTDPTLLGWLVSILPSVRCRRFEPQLMLAETLGRARVPGAGAAIASVLSTGSRPAFVRQRLLLALGEAGDADARRVLAAALASREWSVRSAAARGLGRAGACEDAPLLRGALRKDPSSAVRAAAASALGRFNDAETVEALLEARARDPSPRVAGAALLALQRATREGLFAAKDWRRFLASRPLDPGSLPVPLGPNACALPKEPYPESYHGIPVLAEGAVFLLDISGSMRHDGKLERARRELERTLRVLPPGTLFEVGMFADSVEFLYPALVPASAESVDRACAWVDRRLSPGGRTDFGAALDRALGFERADQVFFLTDGAPTTGIAEQSVIEKVRSLTSSGEVRIHAVGLFTGEKPFRVDAPGAPGSGPVQFLRRVARDSDGVFVRND